MYKLNILALSFLVSGCGAAPRKAPVEDVVEEAVVVEEMGEATKAAKGSNLHEITSVAEFEKLVASNDIVVADFYASWCGPCKQFSPIFDQVAAASPNITFVKIDGDKVPELREREKVQAYPTIKIYKNGKYVENYRGDRTKKALIDYLKKFGA